MRGTMLENIIYNITETTKYALRVANPREAERPAVGWPPEGCIAMTP
jgi:hypothetical protein